MSLVTQKETDRETVGQIDRQTDRQTKTEKERQRRTRLEIDRDRQKLKHRSYRYTDLLCRLYTGKVIPSVHNCHC